MATFSYITRSPHITRTLGVLLGRELRGIHVKRGGALVIALAGDLGAGKTLFVKGCAAGLGITDTIQSPTFVLMKRYPVRTSQFKNFWHIDCYRIRDPQELEYVGLPKLFKDPKNILAIEWPERIKKYIPRDSLRISLGHKKESERRITFRI